MSLRMCDDRLCDECDDLNRAAQTHRPGTEGAEHRGHHPSATGEGH